MEDFINYFNKWQNSPKRKDFLELMMRNHTDIIDTDYNSFFNKKYKTMLTEKSLLSWIKKLLRFYHLSDEEKFDQEILDGEAIKFITINDELNVYASNQINVLFYLKFALNDEKYELASVLRDCSDFIEKEMVRKINWYFIPYSNTEKKELIKETLNIKTTIQTNFGIQTLTNQNPK